MVNSKSKYSFKRRLYSLLSLGLSPENILIGILVLVFILFILYPISRVIITSFYQSGTFTLKHYKDLLQPSNLILIKNSLFVATLSSILATFFALCIALHTYFQTKKIADLIYRALMITMISPPFISALALIMLFGRRGLITHGLLGLSVNPYGWQGIVLLQTLSGISLASIILITALNNVDIRLILASRDLGATPFQTLVKAIIPTISPSIISVLFLQFTMNIADFTTPIIIGGRYRVLATEAYMRVYARGDLGGAAAMTVLLIPPAILAFYFYKNNISKKSTLSERSKVSIGNELNFKLPLVLRIFIGTITVIFFFFMCLKYANIFLSAVTVNTTSGLEFTLMHIHAFQKRNAVALYRTLRMAIISGLLASTLGILLSYYTHRRGLKWMKPIEFIASLPYIIPGIFFGLGYIIAFHTGPIVLTGTTIILILNCTFRHVSVGNKAANAAFENLDKKLELAASDLGASKLKMITTVIFPLLKTTFLLSFINTFTACMTTVGPLIFLVTPRNVVSSVLMFNDINNGRYGAGAVTGSILIIITVSVNLIAIKLLTKERNREHVTRN